MADISKITPPGSQTTYNLKDATAREQAAENKNNISLLCDANGKKQLIPNFGILTNGLVTYTHNSDSTITITGSKEAGTENYVDIAQKSYEDYGLKSGDTIQVVNRDSAPVILAIIFTSSTSASSPNYTMNGTNTYTLPENYTGFRIRLLITSSSTNVNVTINPLVCNKALYDISSAITPYSMSNAELTAAEKQNENNILSKIGASDYATQNTGGTVRVWTTTSGGETTLHIANEAPTP